MQRIFSYYKPDKAKMKRWAIKEWHWNTLPHRHQAMAIECNETEIMNYKSITKRFNVNYVQSTCIIAQAVHILTKVSSKLDPKWTMQFVPYEYYWMIWPMFTVSCSCSQRQTWIIFVLTFIMAHLLLLRSFLLVKKLILGNNTKIIIIVNSTRTRAEN